MKAPVVFMLFVILLATVSIRDVEGAYGSKRAKSASSNTKEEGLQSLREDFDAMDEDHNGSLNKEELSATLPKDEYSSSADEMFTALDANNDGAISFEEIRLGFERLIAGHALDRINEENSEE